MVLERPSPYLNMEPISLFPDALFNILPSVPLNGVTMRTADFNGLSLPNVVAYRIWFNYLRPRAIAASSASYSVYRRVWSILTLLLIC